MALELSRRYQVSTRDLETIPSCPANRDADGGFYFFFFISSILGSLPGLFWILALERFVGHLSTGLNSLEWNLSLFHRPPCFFFYQAANTTLFDRLGSHFCRVCRGGLVCLSVKNHFYFQSHYVLYRMLRYSMEQLISWIGFWGFSFNVVPKM